MTETLPSLQNPIAVVVNRATKEKCDEGGKLVTSRRYSSTREGGPSPGQGEQCSDRWRDQWEATRFDPCVVLS